MTFEFNDYCKAAFSVDNVVFGFDEGDLKILLIKRGMYPFENMWALPGDLVSMDEDLNQAAERVLKQLTGLSNLYLEQVHSFGQVGRHPQGRVITVAYYSLVKISDFRVKAASWAAKAEWHSISKVEDLAFDHNKILESCIASLRARVKSRPVGFELLPPKFTLTELQHLYEAVFGYKIEKRNFRKKILTTDFIVDLNESQEGVAHRPARLYEFDKTKYQDILKSGYVFDFAFSPDNSAKLLPA